MAEFDTDIRALAEAFELFNRTTQTMEESYRRLERRLEDLDRELEAKNRELALTSDYLNSILESMSDGVIAVDNDGMITTMNRAACHALGYEPEAARGEAFEAVFGRVFASPPGRQANVLRSRDSREVQVSERDSPLFDRAGRRIGAVKVFQDMTEIESLRTRLQQQDRLAALGELAATVAHEIRNPLGGIRGFAALLARDLSAEDPRSRLVDKILVGSKELERVVSELLEYTRPVQLRPQTTSCRELVEAALAYVELDGRPVALRNEVAPDMTMEVDPDRMRQVLLNILLNAVQSIEGDGVVSIRAHGEDGRLTIAVRDSGCGMTAEQIEKVFSPFYTTKEKGTGLGLAIATKVVEAHGGRIDVESEPGNGSTFYVRVPME
jgi:PAS domain S-box-containing protein